MTWPSTLLDWGQALRNEDGSYWTGMVYPEEATFPPLERSTYTAGAMVLAADALSRTTPASGLFRGEGLPTHLDLTEPAPEAPTEPAFPAVPRAPSESGRHGSAAVRTAVRTRRAAALTRVGAPA